MSAAHLAVVREIERRAAALDYVEPELRGRLGRACADLAAYDDDGARAVMERVRTAPDHRRQLVAKAEATAVEWSLGLYAAWGVSSKP